MKKYYVHYGNFANTYTLYWAETQEQIEEAEKRGYEQITRKEAEQLCAAENRRRIEEPSLSGYASNIIRPVDYYSHFEYSDDWTYSNKMYKDGYLIEYAESPHQKEDSSQTEPMKKLEDFSIRERRAVENLIATHEELLNTPSDKRITYYFGDYGMHFLKYGITEKEFRPAYEAALKDLGQTYQEFEANAEKYKSRWHVIEDLQTSMIENKTPNIDVVGVFNVTINNEEVYKSYSYKESQRVATSEALKADNYGKKIKVVTAFATTNANLNSVEFEVGKKYELTDIRQSVSISGESLYRIKALKEFVNEATGVVIEKGQLGGFVQSESNLSQDGTCWIDDNARVFNNAKVTDNAYIGDEAMINKNVEVTDNAVVKESVWITQNAKIKDKAYISGIVLIKGNAVIKGEAIVCGNQSIDGNTELSTGIHDGTAAPAHITMQSQSLEM